MRKTSPMVSALCASCLLAFTYVSQAEQLAPSRNKNDSADYPLAVQILSADSEKIRLRYSLKNNTDEDRIVFDIGRSSLRATINNDGVVRLFKGQYDDGTQFDKPQFLQGQVLAAGDTIAENIEHTLPITRDFGDNTEYPITKFEFCIGHASPADQLTRDHPESAYSLKGLTKSNRNECVMLSPP